MTDALQQALSRVRVPGAHFWSLRHVRDRAATHALQRRGRQSAALARDEGAMATVHAGGGAGYAATADLSPAGLQAAFDAALARAQVSAAHGLFDFRRYPAPSPRDSYASPGVDALLPTAASWHELLAAEAAAIPTDDRIVDWTLAVEVRDIDKRYLTSDGGDLLQRQRLLTPSITVTAAADGLAQIRTLNGGTSRATQQGGLEVLANVGFTGAAGRIAEEAIELLLAPNTPDGVRDLLLLPDQMNLQIHESIGHPLELDRILGDERNFAGGSFVTPDLFGHFRYGLELLNITFDPTVAEEQASYAYDDEGAKAERAYLIRNGILERGLGGLLSQARSGLPGVANSRVNGWNRPPIDRMANLNLEPGAHGSLSDLVAGIERGILMKSNSSWSIDHLRNKFQFSCERGRLIERGRLTTVVRNPGYRGISRVFWNNLAAVGDASTLRVVGTGCGKGEPAQGIRVGHASPAAVFRDVEVFGGVR